MAFQVRDAVDADHARIANILRLTFDDVVFAIIYPAKTPAQQQELEEYYCQKVTARSQNPALHYVVATRPDLGEACAGACWQFPVPAGGGGVVSQSAEEEKLSAPSWTQAELLNRFSDALDKVREKHVDYSKDFVLRTLFTDPQFQRQGSGGLLLRWGLGKADREGARVYLEASTAGFELYRRAGFEVIDKFSIDLEEFGGSGTYTWHCMRREPVPAT